MHNAVPMQLLVSSDATSAELHILGNITRGWLGLFKTEADTDANDIAKALADLPETCAEISVHINSMGGEVAQGVAIYNALKAHKAHVTTYCEGFACSIASVVFMAGDRRVMRDASLLMIHNAWMGAEGDSAALRKAADDLDTVTELSKRAYMAHATDSLTREKLDELMDEETWILPEQAVEWGLATEVDVDVDDDEDEDGPEQSAMRALMRKVTEGPRTVAIAEVHPQLDAMEVAEHIVELLKSYEQPEPEANPEPKSFMQRAALLFATDAQ